MVWVVGNSWTIYTPELSGLWSSIANMPILFHHCHGASQVVLVVKNTPASAGNVRDMGSIPGSGRSPGGGHGNPLQYSCLEKPTDRGAWWAIVHGVSRSQTQLEWLSAYTADKALRPAACLNWSISEQPSISSCSEMSSESWSWCLSLVWLQG